MNLSGHHLIIVSGPLGSRRADMTGLMSGGAAFLSTLTEVRKPPVKIDATAPVLPESEVDGTSRHTAVVVIGPEDCFRDERKEGRPLTLPPLPDLVTAWADAVEDTLRRTRIALHRGFSIVIVHGPFSAEQIGRICAAVYTAETSYEISLMFAFEHRPGVISELLRQGENNVPEESVAYVNSHQARTDDVTLLRLSNFVNKKPDRYTVTTVDITAPVEVARVDESVPPGTPVPVRYTAQLVGRPTNEAAAVNLLRRILDQPEGIVRRALRSGSPIQLGEGWVPTGREVKQAREQGVVLTLSHPS